MHKRIHWVQLFAMLVVMAAFTLVIIASRDSEEQPNQPTETQHEITTYIPVNQIENEENREDLEWRWEIEDGQS